MNKSRPFHRVKLDWRKRADMIHRTVLNGGKRPPSMVVKIADAVAGQPPRVPYGVADSRFLALALGGEVGELQNLIKKEWRGSRGRTDRKFMREVAEEMADVRIYLELLANCFGVDLDAECNKKIEGKLMTRWPEAATWIRALETFRTRT